MIGHLEGVVRKVGIGFAIVSCGGVGYKVALGKDSFSKVKLGEVASLWTHLAVREDALDLYGFASEEELSFFHLLLGVPGIGPKSALATLDIASVETLRSAISAGNASYLTRVSGIGKKTAEKIVLELRDKVGASAGNAASLSSDQEALEAMRALGYSADESREALRKVPATVEKSNERLREALRIIGSR